MARNILLSKSFWLITGMLILIAVLIVAIIDVDKKGPQNTVVSYTDQPVITAFQSETPENTPGDNRTPDDAVSTPDTTGNPVPTDIPVSSEPQTTPTQRPTEAPDREPPYFTGLTDISIYLGDSISYKSGVTAIDAKDGEVDYTIDRSAVNTSKTGTYYAYYTAVDSSGNTATEKRKITIKEKPLVNEESVGKLVDNVLKDIIKDGMTKPQKLEAIYKWVTKNIKYAESDEKTELEAAYWGLKRGYGDCFNYYAITHFMLDKCGIDNMMVKRYHKDTNSTHYWHLVNVGTGWYHLDCNPTAKQYPFKCFMCTDAEIYAYNKTRPDKPWYYSFDESLYPPRATEKYSG